MSNETKISSDTKIAGMTLKEIFAACAFLFACFGAYIQVGTNKEAIEANKKAHKEAIAIVDKEWKEAFDEIGDEHEKDMQSAMDRFERMRSNQSSASTDLMVLKSEISHLSETISRLNGAMDRAFPYKGSGADIQNDK